MSTIDTQAAPAPLQVRVTDEMVEAAVDAFDRTKYEGFTYHSGQCIRDFNKNGEEIWEVSTGDYDRDHASMMRQLRLLQMREAIAAALDLSTPPQIAALEAEIVKLRGERDEARMRVSRVHEAMDEGDGFWRSCCGCHELNDGAPTGDYSTIFRAHVGVGCSECGGLGVVWDTTDYADMGDFISREAGGIENDAARAERAEAEVARLTEALEEAARIGWEHGRTSWCPAGILSDKDRTERDWRRAKDELNPSLAALKESTNAQ